MSITTPGRGKPKLRAIRHGMHIEDEMVALDCPDCDAAVDQAAEARYER